MNDLFVGRVAVSALTWNSGTDCVRLRMI